jgi:hypothetical protein
MKLLLRRDQRAALIGSKPVFTLEVRAELTPDESAHLKKYKLGDTLLYEKKPMQQGSNEYAQLGHALAWRFANLTITINDLTNGKKVECKDILEMIGVEEQIKEAARNFKLVLDAAAGFGGEEVLAI